MAEEWRCTRYYPRNTQRHTHQSQGYPTAQEAFINWVVPMSLVKRGEIPLAVYAAAARAAAGEEIWLVWGGNTLVPTTRVYIIVRRWGDQS